VVLNPENKLILKSEHIHKLLDCLHTRNFQVVGPVLRDQAIVYDTINSIDELPVGWTDEQDAGTYRVKSRQDGAYFAYNVGPQSWKQFLHQPSTMLWSAGKADSGFEIIDQFIKAPKYALFGVRACELNAIFIQDKVLTGSGFVDYHYQSRREKLFIVAVNCGHAGGTCFCDSMGMGPQVDSGFDLALTEVIIGDDHHFVVEIGSPSGLQVMSEIPSRPATTVEIDDANHIVDRTRERMGRKVDTSEIKELLYRNYENPRWNDVANRCLACGNCTSVCPTCFCTTVEDVTDLTGDHVERWKRWDSCFTLDFSYIHGGNIRHSIRARYRQWLMHKLGTWIDQFGSTGCVGCGRCITWCPAAIDITEEVCAIRETDY
jgi:ferredoxin